MKIATAANEPVTHSVAIGLGTNVGDRFDNLVRALESLRGTGTLTALSRIYGSAPVGYLDQPEFWNAVALLATAYSPLQLFRNAQEIEREVGRVPTFPGGPRVIDIDVLLYDDFVIATEQLQVPHPRMHQRAFVLRPLAALEPDRVHPLLGRTMRELLDGVTEQQAAPLAEESRRLHDRLGLRTGRTT